MQQPHFDCVFSFPLTNIQKTVSKMKPQGRRPPYARVTTTRVKNMCFSRVAHDFFSTSGSESGFVCPARGNKVHSMSR